MNLLIILLSACVAIRASHLLGSIASGNDGRFDPRSFVGGRNRIGQDTIWGRQGNTNQWNRWGDRGRQLGCRWNRNSNKGWRFRKQKGRYGKRKGRWGRWGDDS